MKRSYWLAALAVVLMGAAASPDWPRWLDWLFGERIRTTAGIERTKVEQRTNPDGTLTISEQYTVRWTPDGNGSPDSLLLTGTATGLPSQVFNSGTPQFPKIIIVSWTSPAPGTALSTQLCGRVRRRAAYSAATCSAIRPYATPDVPPPPIAIDTTDLAMRLRFLGDSTDAATGQAVLKTATDYEMCLLFRIGGHAGSVGADPRCATLTAKAFPLASPLTVAEQVWIDTRCMNFKSRAVAPAAGPGGAFSNLPNTCWTVGGLRPRVSTAVGL